MSDLERQQAERRAAAAARAEERAAAQAAGHVEEWSAQGGVPATAIGVVAGLAAAGLCLMFVGAISGLAAGVVVGAGVGAAVGFGTRAVLRSLDGGSGTRKNPRLEKAYGDAVAALDAAESLDAARRAELKRQLRTARAAIASAGATPAVLTERVEEFENQARRLVATAGSFAPDAPDPTAALSAAIGDLKEDARARAEVDEALAEAGAGAAAPKTGLLE